MALLFDLTSFIPIPFYESHHEIKKRHYYVYNKNNILMKIAHVTQLHVHGLFDMNRMRDLANA